MPESMTDFCDTTFCNAQLQCLYFSLCIDSFLKQILEFDILSNNRVHLISLLYKVILIACTKLNYL